MRIINNTINDPKLRQLITDAVIEAGAQQRDGCGAYTSEFANSQAWTVGIIAPGGVNWSREFFGPDEQTSDFIRERITDALIGLSRTSG
jgi:hypothetical protein